VDLLTNEWLFWMTLLLLGMGIGFVLGRNHNANNREQQKLRQQLLETQTQLTTYKEQVNEHFTDTATLVNNLTESYRQIHRHLASGAHYLCDDPATAQDIARALDTPDTDPGKDLLDSISEQQQTVVITAPMDYAPRPMANYRGTLAEEYDLQHPESQLQQPCYDILYQPEPEKS
jgi:uncharacterized protein